MPLTRLPKAPLMASSTGLAHTAKERTALSMAAVSMDRKAGKVNSQSRGPAAVSEPPERPSRRAAAWSGVSHWSMSSGWASVSTHSAAWR